MNEAILDPGMWSQDMLNDEYHATRALGSSGIKRLLKSPAVYRYECDNPPKPTRAMEIGTYTHAGVLEPELFNETWFRLPEGDKRRKEYKDQVAEAALANPGKSGIDPATWDQIHAMRDAVLAHPMARKLIQPQSRAMVEASFFWNWDGVECKCRPDFYCPAESYVVDLKTTQDASPEGFARNCANFGYHIQEAFYRTGLAAHNRAVDRFYFLAVEKEPPYLVGVYTLDGMARMTGRHKCEEALSAYMSCEQTGDWPGLSNEVIQLELPRWAVPQDPPKSDDLTAIRSVNSVKLEQGSMLTLDQACELAGCSRVTLYNWMNDGLAYTSTNPNLKRSPRLIKAEILQEYIDAKQAA
jgi:predicted DNA-binding transcriptional regulator AlpA